MLSMRAVGEGHISSIGFAEAEERCENELPFDGILKLPERARALSAEKIRDATRKYFSSDNLLIARLLPEETKNASSRKVE